jgi:hypothetical protein
MNAALANVGKPQAAMPFAGVGFLANRGAVLAGEDEPTTS